MIMFGLMALVSSSPVTAQTKKKTVKKSPTPRPTPVQTAPQVISQADYTKQNQEIITGGTEQPVLVPVQETAPTLEEKIDNLATRLQEMSTRMRSMEASKQNQYDDAQKRLLMNLDILTRAEQRSESLRKQLFEMIEKENTIRTRIEVISFEARGDIIDRQVSMAGSLRPEELRESRRRSLESESRNLQTLLLEVQSTKSNLEQNLQKADQLVERLRIVLEKDIDAALTITNEP
jgi:hypothetical protein